MLASSLARATSTALWARLAPSGPASSTSSSLSGRPSPGRPVVDFSRSQLQPHPEGPGVRGCRPPLGALASGALESLQVPAGEHGHENGAELGLLSDAFYTYGKQEVMRNVGSEEAVDTRGRTAKCRTQQPAQHASKNARAVRVPWAPCPSSSALTAWRLQHAQGSVRETDWDDQPQAPPQGCTQGARNGA